jgi:hypothetical protein
MVIWDLVNLCKFDNIISDHFNRIITLSVITLITIPLYLYNGNNFEIFSKKLTFRIISERGHQTGRPACTRGSHRTSSMGIRGRGWGRKLEGWGIGRSGIKSGRFVSWDKYTSSSGTRVVCSKKRFSKERMKKHAMQFWKNYHIPRNNSNKRFL